MKITVNYPTSETRVSVVPASGVINPFHPELSRERTVVTTVPVNRAVAVNVKHTARSIQEMFMDGDDYSREQTGLTAAAYQAKHKRAFNE